MRTLKDIAGKYKRRDMSEFSNQTVSQIQNCKSADELSFVIWTKELEEAMQSSREIYRIPFRLWIEEYIHDLPHKQWRYKDPSDLANGIWNFCLPEDEKYYKQIKDAFIGWVENFKLLNNKLENNPYK